jgi:hypothetical protein
MAHTRRHRKRSGGSGLGVGNLLGSTSLLGQASPVNGSMMGGRSRRRRRHGGARRSRSRSHSRSRSGGFGAGLGIAATLKEALVPFGLFAWQKRTQRRSRK